MDKITNLIKNKSLEQKHVIKAREIAKIKFPKVSFILGEYIVKFIDTPVEVGGLLKFSIEAKKGDIDIPVSNPIYIKNPPVRVYISNNETVEDPEQAIKGVIFDLLRGDK